MIKNLVKQWTPPAVWQSLRWLKSINPLTPFYGVNGEFSSWEKAQEYCAKNHHKSGYEAENIIDKVATAIQEVRKGNAEFERDSVLFYEKEYNYQFLSSLFMSICGCGENRSLNIVDFGGSLGSSYFQNRSLLNSIKYPPVWNIIEQKHFVDRGRLEVPEIKFWYTIEEYIEKGGQCDVLLLSSVLEYMQSPFEMLAQLLNYNWKYVIIDRSLYHPDDKDCIVVQTVPPAIYDAQYPLWLRSVSKQHSILKNLGYNMLLDWVLPFIITYKDSKMVRTIPFKGFIYKNTRV